MLTPFEGLVAYQQMQWTMVILSPSVQEKSFEFNPDFTQF